MSEPLTHGVQNQGLRFKEIPQVLTVMPPIREYVLKTWQIAGKGQQFFMCFGILSQRFEDRLQRRESAKGRAVLSSVRALSATNRPAVRRRALGERAFSWAS